MTDGDAAPIPTVPPARGADSAPAAIVADFRTMYTPLISDALDGLGRRDCVMEPGLAPVTGDGSSPTVGWAFPVRFRPTDEWVDIDRVLEMIDSVPAGGVVVMGGDEPTTAALWGGLCSTGVINRGAAGVVVDGAIRDYDQISRLGFPVYATHRSPRDIRSRAEILSIGEPVRCRGVHVRAGDLVVADANGVVVVPAELIPDVRVPCLDRMAQERRASEALRAGLGARDAYERFQVF
jgi:4-hydroxy-4-methyl-2-oxoglutarate aldolase